MIYLDYNATTPMCDNAREAMAPFLGPKFGNPSSVHAAGQAARAAVDEARDRLAALFQVKAHELIFCSGGTEANNLAVLGLARRGNARGKHIISARTEHHAVLNAFEHLEQFENFEVTWLEVGRDGRIDPEQLQRSLRDDTALVSLMLVNNETGAIQPLSEISECCRARGVPLHSDMVQAFGKTEVDLSLVDAASFAAHKFYGPKGAGLVFVRSGFVLSPLGFGGAHENQRRPGTENVAAIAGMAASADWTMQTPSAEHERLMRDDLWRALSSQLEGVQLNHDFQHSLGNTLNVSFPALDSETMLMALDLEGVCASSGSACMVGSVVASHVLLAQGAPLPRARSAIRFSLGKFNRADEITQTAEAVGRTLRRHAAIRKIA